MPYINYFDFIIPFTICRSHFGVHDVTIVYHLSFYVTMIKGTDANMVKAAIYIPFS